MTAVTASLVGVHRMLNTWTKTVDRFITPTEFARRKCIAGGLPANRIVVKPNFLRQDPGVGSGRGGFAVFVGRLSTEKGIDTLLAAWERLPGDLSLKIVGDGPLDDRVRTAAAGAANIEWVGQLPIEQVLSIIGDASCLVVPSICYETFGRTAVEAFAKGTPVIASRLGAVREVVRNGVTGLHFRPGDPDDLACKLQRLLSDPERSVALGKAARREYETKYTAQSNYDQLLQIYEAAARRQREISSSKRPARTRLISTNQTTAPSNSAGRQPFDWPATVDLFGIPVTPTNYEEATDAILSASAQGVPGVVSCHAVHAVVTTSRDESLRKMVNRFDMITPDGQPVRWALNLLYGAKLRDRVYGPTLTLALCERAAAEGVAVYLYGGSPEVVEQLQTNLRVKFPQLQIAGFESPPFRQLTPQEDREVVERINQSGAGLVFIGLGCPKQDIFAGEHRDRIQAVQVCVGAAFDFHAGVKKTAPDWMQKRGLEWAFRLWEEPGRLWKRYLATNSLFLWMLLCAWLTPSRTPGRKSSWPATILHPFVALAAITWNTCITIFHRFVRGSSKRGRSLSDPDRVA